MFKKFFVGLFICFTFLGLTAFAQDGEELTSIEFTVESTAIQHSPTVKPHRPSASAYSEDDVITAFKNSVVSQLRELKASVVVVNFGIPVEDFETAAYLAFDALDENPDLFYVGKCITGGQQTASGYIYSLTFEFYYEGEDLTNRVNAFREETEKAISLVNDNMTDLEKALTLHDYLAVSAEYHSEAAETKDTVTYRNAWTSYGVLVDKIGVCQSYSLAYRHLLNLVGINNVYAESNEMNHIWNIIQIDGKWYHVDITWDDPTYDRFGYVRHNYFLLSDNAIFNDPDPHYSWYTYYYCESNDLDDAYFRNARGPVVITDEYNYYIDNAHIKKYNESTSTEETIYTIEDKWYVWGSNASYYTDKWSDLYLYNNKLYFNTPTAIKTINLDGSGAETFYSYEENKGYIYGIIKDGTTLSYCIATTPTDKDEIHYLPTRYVTATLNGNILVPSFNSHDTVSGKLFVSVFDSKGNYLSSQLYDANSPINPEINKGTGNYIRLMWWDMQTLTPYSPEFKLNF